MYGRNIFDLIHTSWRWPIILICVVLLFVNASGTLKIDALLDSTPEENINKFLSSVENINPDYTMGEVKSGIKIYDENRITYPMMYGMGDKEYFVYVFTKDLPKDSAINLELENYVVKEDSLPVYAIESNLLLGTLDEIYYDMSPVVLRLKRDNSVDGKPITSVQNYYNTIDLIKSEVTGAVLSNESSSNSSTPESSKSESETEESNNWFLNLIKGNKSESDSESPTETETKTESTDDKKGLFDKLFSKDGDLR